VNSGIWVWSGGQRQAVAFGNQLAPGAGGARFQYLSTLNTSPPTRMTANQSGLLAIETFLDSGQMGIWTHTDSQGLRLAALSGVTTFTGLSSSVRLATSYPMSLNAAGQIAMRCSLSGTGNTFTDTAVVVGTPNGSTGSSPTHNFRIVAREGDAVPGRNPAWRLAVTGSYDNLFSEAQINSVGTAVFSSEITDATGNNSFGSGVFRNRGPAFALETLAATGDVAVDRPVQLGAVLATALSDSGDVALLSTTTSSTAGAVFVYSQGSLRTIAVVGDQVQVAAGSFRTISELLGTDNGFPSPWPTFDSSGTLYYWAKFSDGSTAMLAATVPAPWSSLLLGVAGCCAFRRRRNRYLN
jgi:hypothetical protein